MHVGAGEIAQQHDQALDLWIRQRPKQCVPVRRFVEVVRAGFAERPLTHQTGQGGAECFEVLENRIGKALDGV